MSSNGITAEEARRLSESSDYDAVEDALKTINNIVKSDTKKRKTFAKATILNDGIDSNALDYIVSDLKNRGFKVKATVKEIAYYFEISW